MFPGIDDGGRGKGREKGRGKGKGGRGRERGSEGEGEEEERKGMTCRMMLISTMAVGSPSSSALGSVARYTFKHAPPHAEGVCAMQRKEDKGVHTLNIRSSTTRTNKRSILRIGCRYLYANTAEEVHIERKTASE